MTTITVNTDTDLSTLSPTLDDTIEIISDATLTIDTCANMKILQLGNSSTEGHIIFAGYDATLSSPTIVFKSDRGMGSGMVIYAGSIKVEDPFSERIIIMSEKKSRGIRDWCIKAGYGCDISNDLRLIDTDPIELYGVAFAIIYHDSTSEETLILPHSATDVTRKLSLDVDDKKAEKGYPWQEYNFADGEKLSFGFRFLRDQVDRYERRRINHYSTKHQKERNILLVSEYKLGFGKIHNLRFGSVSPKSYDFSFEFLEERL